MDWKSSIYLFLFQAVFLILSTLSSHYSSLKVVSIILLAFCFITLVYISIVASRNSYAESVLISTTSCFIDFIIWSLTISVLGELQNAETRGYTSTFFLLGLLSVFIVNLIAAGIARLYWKDKTQ